MPRFRLKDFVSKTVFKASLFLVALLLFSTCGTRDTSWVMKVENVRIQTDEFLKWFKWSQEYKNADSFTPEDLRAFAERKFGPELLFAAEGYRLGIDKKPSVQYAIHQREIEIIGDENGPLFLRVVPQTLVVTDQEVEAYIKKSDQLANVKITDAVKDSIRTLLMQAKKGKYIKQYAAGLFPKYHFRVIPAGADLLIKLTTLSRKEARELARRQDPRQVLLLTFADARLTVNDVLMSFPEDFRSRRKKFHSLEQVREYLMEKFLPELMFLDARDRGLFDLPQVKAAFEKSKRRIISAECEKALTVRNIKVTQQEVEQRYQQDMEKYKNMPPKRAKYDIRILLHAEKRNQKYRQTREELEKKYKIIYNNAAFKYLARELNREKQSATT